MNGVLVVDKPADYTSFDVVAVVRRLAGREKTGHTGTLDPMATGVLPVLLGKATRAASLLEDTSKEYRAEFAFGYATDTQDSTGEVLMTSDARITEAALLAALPHFYGNILQEPPMYSAVRREGKRLYELARQGITVEREKRPVTIERLDCIRFDEASQTGALEVRCSKGTYIRTLCADIAGSLGTCGVMTALRRTSACGFSLTDAVPLDAVRALAEEGRLEPHVLPVDRLFSERPALRVSVAQAVRFRNGGSLDLARTALAKQAPPDGLRLRVYDPEGTFLGLGVVDCSRNALKILKLFV